MSGTSLAVLVTPVYKSVPDDDERWNIARTRVAMPHVDHVFVGPAGLDPAPYLRLSAGSRFAAAVPAHFRGVWEYSRMMLDPRFYARFDRYDFMVVAQPDAFLVRDLSRELGHAEYDYAGAPWHRPYLMSGTNVYSRRLGELQRPFIPPVSCVVGNGGLSIRRIPAFVRLLRRRPLLHRYARSGEDLVLSYLGSRGALRLASPERAGRLFFESSDSSDVPMDVFGYHALQRFHPDRYAAFRAATP